MFQGDGKEIKDISPEALFDCVKFSTKPFNFRDDVSDWDAFLSAQELELRQETLAKNNEARQEQDAKMKEGKTSRKKDIEEKLRVLRDHEKDNVENKSLALRS